MRLKRVKDKGPSMGSVDQVCAENRRLSVVPCFQFVGSYFCSELELFPEGGQGENNVMVPSEFA